MYPKFKNLIKQLLNDNLNKIFFKYFILFNTFSKP